jgi:TfoX/Sxy family transcriptional regulator of competence genes
MPKADPKQYAASLALYEKLVATNTKVERKGATMPYTSLNGHMFSLLTKEGWLALRLPSDAREAFLKKYQTKLCVQYGTVMKEYVQVPDDLLKKTTELRKYFDQSYAYVGSLKPKPTTRKAAAKKR